MGIAPYEEAAVSVRSRSDAWLFERPFTISVLDPIHPDNDEDVRKHVDRGMWDELIDRHQEPGCILEDGHSLFREFDGRAMSKEVLGDD